MDTNEVEMYYEMLDRLNLISNAIKWLNKDGCDWRYDCIISQTEKLYKNFLAFGINNIGMIEN